MEVTPAPPLHQALPPAEGRACPELAKELEPAPYSIRVWG